MPPRGDARCAAKQSIAAGPSPGVAASSAITAKAGAAARPSPSAVPRNAATPPLRIVLLEVCRLVGIRHLHPYLVGLRPCLVIVVPDPPFIGRGLGITRGRILPRFLPAERGQVEIAPGRAHRLVAAIDDEIGAEAAVAVADEGVVAMPLVDAEIRVEAVGDGVFRFVF